MILSVMTYKVLLFFQPHAHFLNRRQIISHNLCREKNPDTSSKKIERLLQVFGKTLKKLLRYCMSYIFSKTCKLCFFKYNLLWHKKRKDRKHHQTVDNKNENNCISWK